ncbi:hypothetical protein JOM56_002816 [Amanita muscaria]
MDVDDVDPVLRQYSLPPRLSGASQRAFDDGSDSGQFSHHLRNSEPPYAVPMAYPSQYPYATTPSPFTPAASPPPGPIYGSSAQGSHQRFYSPEISPAQTNLELPPPLMMPPPPPPLPPATEPFTPMAGKAFNREHVIWEFTAVRMELQNLQQAMHHVQDENKALLQQNSLLRNYIKQLAHNTHQKVEGLERQFLMTQSTARKPKRQEDEDGEVAIVENLPPKVKEEEERAKQSKTAAKSNEIKISKALVREIFKIFLGITKLNETDAIPVMEEIYDRNSLPFVRGSSEIHQVCFHWNRDLHDKHNHETLSILLEHAELRGPDLVQDVRKFLAMITTPDLRKVFDDQFNRLKKVAKGTHIKKEEDGITVNKNRDTRAKGKLEARSRKREVLPDGHEYRDPKYDAAYAYQLLSDDDDVPVTNANEPRVFISHAPLYRSKLLNDMWDAIDAIPDPSNPRQYTFEGRLRRWMVDLEWLAEHPEANNEEMIADNGRLWGDTEDPEETIARLKKASADKKSRKRKTVAEDGANGGPSTSKPQPQKSMRRTRSQTARLREIEDEAAMTHNDDDLFS